MTVRQPWAWAIVHGGKNVENRTQLSMWRAAAGQTIAIHAGAQLSEHGMADLRVGHALRDRGHIFDPNPFAPPGLAHLFGAPIHLSAILGVVDVDDVHLSVSGCCEPWGEQTYVDSVGVRRSEVVHLVLTNPRPLRVPIPIRGKLGLWHLDDDTAEQIRSDLAPTPVSA